MADPPKHIEWLKDAGDPLTTKGGQKVEIWTLDSKEDEEILSDWARHFRQHYCSDEELPALVEGTGKTPAEYLTSILFPDATATPGPSLRSGDFGEILVADFIEYILGYWCPRTLRYQDRWNRNDSTKGCDVIGFKFDNNDGHHPRDELFVFEAKSGMTKKKDGNRLQDALTDSIKDHLREAMTLNALKQRFLVRGDLEHADKIKRFQNEAERPFKRINGAAAILDSEVLEETDFSAVDETGHPNIGGLRLLVIAGPSLMQLVHALYERAANEA